ncbi:unnamed protein product [Anisakis simplex]|uniref:Tr-type G domain-containing protein n=1 Tax=Anisakis simplex TaxID=6269 RepID=A0A3P6RCB4_ANISI|nr:unnamed protein product [Anisakis simplex]
MDGESVSINVGILGHVDCGKTTLARSISNIASTASFDKHAKAQNLRANTIDLGFSSLRIDNYTIALIDCPGHASLISAVLCASSVFDMAIIVVDAQKGVQAQTAEHLLLVSILCPQHAIVVINKIDLITAQQLNSLRKQLIKILKYFSISENSPIVCISLLEDDVVKSSETIIDALRRQLYRPKRYSTSNQFVMSVDHCFPVRGKGTVMTGTIIDGSCRFIFIFIYPFRHPLFSPSCYSAFITEFTPYSALIRFGLLQPQKQSCSIGMEIEIAALKVKRRIKGIQRWKEDVQRASMGERVGLLFQDLNAKHLDRTVIFQPGALESVQCVLANITKISHFKAKLLDRAKVHLSVGFETVMATCHFLVKHDEEFEQMADLDERVTMVLLVLDRSIWAIRGSFYLATKLDMQQKGCRFAFYGTFDRFTTNINALRRFHRKHRSGLVERLEGDNMTLICALLFSKNSDISVFIDMKVVLSTGDIGLIEASFGKSGKVRIRIPQGVSEKTVSALKAGEKVNVELWMKKYLNEDKLLCYVP